MRAFQFPILFSVVSLLTGSIHALPEAYPATSSKSAPGKEFYLKTQVQQGQDHTKNGLYLASYHIGENSSDVTKRQAMSNSARCRDRRCGFCE